MCASSSALLSSPTTLQALEETRPEGGQGSRRDIVRVHIPLPENLKKQLVDDSDFVNVQQKVRVEALLCVPYALRALAPFLCYICVARVGAFLVFHVRCTRFAPLVAFPPICAGSLVTKYARQRSVYIFATLSVFIVFWHVSPLCPGVSLACGASSLK